MYQCINGQLHLVEGDCPINPCAANGGTYTANINFGEHNDDGLPITIVSLDGKKHTFMVSDFVDTKLKKTVTHVQRQGKDEPLT